MSNNENKLIEDMREVVPEVREKQLPAFGPGYVNLAVPDRGHAGSCIAKDFANAAEFNAFCEGHTDWLTILVSPTPYGVLAIFQVLKTDLEIEERQQVARFTEEKMSEYRAKRAEQEATVEKARKEQEEADDACRRIGRLCIENHGAFVEALPGLSKIKVTRKSIADDIIKLVEQTIEAGIKAGTSAVINISPLEKVLTKYVKDGVK